MTRRNLRTALVCSTLGLIGQGVSVSAEQAVLGASEVRLWLERHPEFLLDHPELIARAQTLNRERQEAALRVERRKFFDAFAENLQVLALVTGRGQPVDGTVYAFTDYECLPCREDEREMLRFLAAHPTWQVVDVPLGIMATASAEAVDAVLSATTVDRARKLHDGFKAAPLPLSYARARAPRSHETGAGWTTLSSGALRDFAGRMGVQGVPTYLVKCSLFAGRFDASRMLQVVECPPPGSARVR
jgi:hypothetical protein